MGDTITRTLDLPAAAKSGEQGAALMGTATSVDWPVQRLQWIVGIAMAVMLALVLLRLWFIDGLLRRVTIDGPSMAPSLCGETYEVTCGDCAFPFRCDAEHVPDNHLAACPNCGYARNDLDDASLLSPERVVIDRWRLLMRWPRRGEVVACAVPKAPGEAAVKRVAGAPGEQLAIQGGDRYVNGKLVQKTRAELNDVRLLVHDNDYQPGPAANLTPRWRGATQETQWQPQGGAFERPAQASDNAEWDWLEYQHWACTADERQRGKATAVRDNDSHNQGETRRPLNAVSDVQLTCHATFVGAGELAFAASDGERRFAVVIEPRRRVVVQSDSQTLLELPLHLQFARVGSDIEFGLCDQQVFLVVQGRTLVRLPYERAAAAPRETLHPLAIGVRGLGARISRLRVWRDIYDLDPQGLGRPWETARAVGVNGFLLVGDNPPVSIDCRQWESPFVAASAIRGVVYRPFWAAGSPVR